MVLFAGGAVAGRVLGAGFFAGAADTVEPKAVVFVVRTGRVDGVALGSGLVVRVTFESGLGFFK